MSNEKIVVTEARPASLTEALRQQAEENRCLYCGEVHHPRLCPEFNRDMAEARAEQRKQQDWEDGADINWCCGHTGANHVENCLYDDEPF